MRRISQKDAEAIVSQFMELMELLIKVSTISEVVDELELEKGRTVDAVRSLSAKYSEEV
jgi:hypothetical protein